MENNESIKPFSVKSKQIIHLAIQLLAVAILIKWSFEILAPFFTPIIWAAILAVSLFPLHQRLTRALKDRSILAAIIITIVFLIFFLAIISWLGFRAGEEVKSQITAFKDFAAPHQPPLYRRKLLNSSVRQQQSAEATLSPCPSHRYKFCQPPPCGFRDIVAASTIMGGSK